MLAGFFFICLAGLGDARRFLFFRGCDKNESIFRCTAALFSFLIRLRRLSSFTGDTEEPVPEFTLILMVTFLTPVDDKSGGLSTVNRDAEVQVLLLISQPSDLLALTLSSSLCLSSGFDPFSLDLWLKSSPGVFKFTDFPSPDEYSRLRTGWFIASPDGSLRVKLCLWALTEITLFREVFSLGTEVSIIWSREMGWRDEASNSLLDWKPCPIE